MVTCHVASGKYYTLEVIYHHWLLESMCPNFPKDSQACGKIWMFNLVLSKLESFFFCTLTSWRIHVLTAIYSKKKFPDIDWEMLWSNRPSEVLYILWLFNRVIILRSPFPLMAYLVTGYLLIEWYQPPYVDICSKNIDMISCSLDMNASYHTVSRNNTHKPILGVTNNYKCLTVSKHIENI